MKWIKKKKNDDRYKLIIIANFICRVWSLLHALLTFLGNAYRFNKEKERKNQLLEKKKPQKSKQKRYSIFVFKPYPHKYRPSSVFLLDLA